MGDTMCIKQIKRFFRNYNRKIKKFKCWDIGLVKLVCIIIGLVIGAYFPAWVITNIVWIVIIGAVALIIALIRWFRK